MHLKIFAISFTILLTFPGLTFPQDQVTRIKTNLELVSDVIDDVLGKFRNNVVITGRDRIYNVTLQDRSEAGELFFSALKIKFDNFNFVYDGLTDTLPGFSIKNVKVETNYPEIKQSNILGEKVVSRTVNVGIEMDFTDPETDRTEEQSFYSSRSDSFRLTDIDFVENRNFSFGYADVPQEDFISRILLPAGLVIVSAATIILFFVIRSK